MYELVINGAVTSTGPERKVRLAGSDKIRPLCGLYDNPWCRTAILAAARAIHLGPARRFYNGRANLTIEIRPTGPTS